MSFTVNFRFISVEISAEKNFLEKFYCTKRFVFEFQGGLLSYFWAIVLISAVISILDDFGSLLPARTVTVNANSAPWIQLTVTLLDGKQLKKKDFLVSTNLFPSVSIVQKEPAEK